MEWFGFGRQLSSASAEAWGGLDSCWVRHIVQGLMRSTIATSLTSDHLGGHRCRTVTQARVWATWLGDPSVPSMWLLWRKSLKCSFSSSFETCTISAFPQEGCKCIWMAERESSLAPTSPHPFRCPQVCKTPPSSSSMTFFHDFWSRNHWRIPLSHFLNPTVNLFPPPFFFLFIIRNSNSQTDGDGSGGCINQEGHAAASVCSRFWTNATNESQKVWSCFHAIGRRRNVKNSFLKNPQTNKDCTLESLLDETENTSGEMF